MLNPDQKQKAWKDGKIEISINEQRSWASFANSTAPPEEIENHTYATVSCESFHDGIHGMIGTGRGYLGHMGNPSFAAVSILQICHHATKSFTVRSNLLVTP